MSQESIPPNNPSTREKEIAQNAYKDADPTTYSMLPPTGELARLSQEEEKALGSRSSDERFYKHEEDILYDISESHPLTAPVQQVVARILKGVVNVSDIVNITQDGIKDFIPELCQWRK